MLAPLSIMQARSSSIGSSRSRHLTNSVEQTVVKQTLHSCGLHDHRRSRNFLIWTLCIISKIYSIPISVIASDLLSHRTSTLECQIYFVI